MDRYTVEPVSTEISVSQFLETYVDPPRFLSSCKECGNYGTVWSCPPYAFQPEELWRRYETLRLYGRRLIFTPAAREKRYSAQELGQVLEETLYRERDNMSEELLRLERSTPNSLAILAGSCRICKTCTRRSGEPCRHPERVRCSIESLGGDVGRIMDELLHMPLQWIQDGMLPEYLTLMGGLLVGH